MSSENEDRENVPGKEEDEQDFFNEEELIREGMNVHVRDSQGRTPLHEAVQFCFDDNSILSLLALGADIHARDVEGRTPLHLSNSYVVDILVAGGADINACDNRGQTALHLATEYNEEMKVEILLFLGADVNVCDDEGRTPLHVAAYYRHDFIVDMLLQAGSNVFALDKKGKTPLDLAQNGDQKGAVPFLFFFPLCNCRRAAVGADIKNILAFLRKNLKIYFTETF